MPDTPNTEPDSSKVDNVPLEMAIRALTSDIKKSAGGWNPDGYNTPIQGHFENGVRIITYTFDALPSLSFNKADGISNLSPLGAEQRDAVVRCFDEIQKVANVKFRLVGHKEKIEKADLCFLQANLEHDKGLQIGTGSKTRCVIINKSISVDGLADGNDGYGTMAHEILHALGVSHPDANGKGGDAGGYNPLYTNKSTIMSYNETYPQLLQKYDLAVLQYIYGKSKHVQEEQVLRLTDEPNPLIYSEKKVRLELENSDPVPRSVDLELPRFRKTPQAAVPDFTALPTSKAGFDVYGNNERNEVHSEHVRTSFWPKNGNDRFYVGEKGGEVILCPKSGFDNIVEGFVAPPLSGASGVGQGGQGKCVIDICSDLKTSQKAELRSVQRELGGKSVAGTNVMVLDAENKPLASVFVAGLSPQETASCIRTIPDRRITSATKREHRISVEIIPGNALMSSDFGHPSGLPPIGPVHRSVDAPGQRR